jgi:hypothetical protein
MANTCTDPGAICVRPAWNLKVNLPVDLDLGQPVKPEQHYLRQPVVQQLEVR